MLIGCQWCTCGTHSCGIGRTWPEPSPMSTPQRQYYAWAWRSPPSSSDSLCAPPVPLLSSQADMRLAMHHLSPRRTSPAHLSSQLALDAFHEQTSPGTVQTSLPNSHSDGTRHHHKATTLHTLLLKILLAGILCIFQHFWRWRPKPSAAREYRPTMTSQLLPCAHFLPLNCHGTRNAWSTPQTSSVPTARAFPDPWILHGDASAGNELLDLHLACTRDPTSPPPWFQTKLLMLLMMMMISMLISMMISMIMLMPRTLLLPPLMSGTIFLYCPAKCRALSSAMTYFLQDFHVRDLTHAQPTNSDFTDSQRHSVLSPQHEHTCHATSGSTWTPALAPPSTPAVAAISASCPKRSTLAWLISPHMDTTRHHPTHLRLSCLLKLDHHDLQQKTSETMPFLPSHLFIPSLSAQTSPPPRQLGNIMILHAHRPEFPALQPETGNSFCRLTCQKTKCKTFRTSALLSAANACSHHLPRLTPCTNSILLPVPSPPAGTTPASLSYLIIQHFEDFPSSKFAHYFAALSTLSHLSSQ